VSQSEELNSIATTLACIEEQREATTTDILLLMHWHDLATKKRKEAQKQIPVTNLFKK
jgi:hypothetical protein